jgi:hypothetical protein
VTWIVSALNPAKPKPIFVAMRISSENMNLDESGDAVTCAGDAAYTKTTTSFETSKGTIVLGYMPRQTVAVRVWTCGVMVVREYE